MKNLIEQVAAKPLGSVVHELICNPLGLKSIELWNDQERSATLHWTAAADYNPRWVYHGCLVGSAADASRLLHALFSGDLLNSESMASMLNRRALGGAIPNRPWVECGYSLGLMSGSVTGPVRAIGHSGAGPFCVNAVYHFPDLADPMTVATFTTGSDEGVAEFAAANLATGQRRLSSRANVSIT